MITTNIEKWLKSEVQAVIRLVHHVKVNPSTENHTKLLLWFTRMSYLLQGCQSLDHTQHGNHPKSAFGKALTPVELLNLSLVLLYH